MYGISKEGEVNFETKGETINYFHLLKGFRLIIFR